MKLLLDTHVVLWLGDATAVIPAGVREAVGVADGEILLSAVVIWEVAIKSALGKLKAPDDFPRRVTEYGFVPLPVAAEHAWGVRALPPRHGDPFDRLLIAQARAEGATLVSADAVMRRYDVPVLWD